MNVARAYHPSSLRHQQTCINSNLIPGGDPLDPPPASLLIERVILSAGAMLIFSVSFQIDQMSEDRVTPEL
jgi:hypothetical protein